MRALLRSVSGVVVLLLVLATLVPTGAAQAQPGGDDPLLQDAQQYAAAYGVDVDEALRRLEVQAAAGRLDAALGAQTAPTFAGLWVQHEPIFLVVVRFVGRSSHDLSRYLSEEDHAILAPFIDQRPAAVPLARLAEVQGVARGVARQQDVPVDSSINVIENRVDLRTTDPARLATALGDAERTLPQAATLQLRSNVEVIEVDELAVPEAYVYGGLPLSTCTSGFAVQKGSTLGVLTAGHCPSSQVYNGRTLPFQAEAFSGSSDAQWHTAPGLFVTNRVYDGIVDSTTPLYRPVTGTRTRAQQVVGEFVCKYGMTTGYTCGTIQSKSYAPSYVPSVVATFIYVAGGSVNLSEGGDSGGPWFSGSNAYGVHSGGAGNDSIYMAIDYVAPLGVSVLTTTPVVDVGTWTYRNTGDNIFYYTGINATDYECALTGWAARDGDIQENDTGNIIQTYLYKDRGHWRIRGDFRSHGNHESWDMDVLCLKKSVFPVRRFEYRSLGDNVNYNTGLSTSTYECGVAGFAALDGDIQEHNDGDIIKVNTYRNGDGKWWIRSDFRTHNNSETWNVDLMCVEKWAPVIRYEFRNLGDNINHNTFINSNTYECGVAGIAAIDGDIQEHDAGDIIQTYLYKSSGTWRIRADFRTHNDSESWDVDVLCVAR